MNKEIQTPQIKFCEKDWASLDFNRVTSKTLSKNKLAIRNKMKKGKGLVEREHKSQEAKADREACAQNYQKQFENTDIRTPVVLANRSHVYGQYTVAVKNRDVFINLFFYWDNELINLYCMFGGCGRYNNTTSIRGI